MRKESKPGMGKHTAVPEKPEGRKGKVALIVLAVIAGVVLAAYLAGVLAFSFLFMPNTTLDGTDVSLRLASDVSAEFATKASTYKTKVKGDGIDLDLSGSDVNLTFDQGAYTRDIVSQQHAWEWPLRILASRDIKPTTGASVDVDKLDALLSPLVDEINKTATQPTDATIGFSEQTQQYEVVPEAVGTAIDMDATVKKISTDVMSLPASITLDDSCLVQAKVTQDEPSLATAAQNANRFMKADIPLTLNGMQAGEVTRTQISNWIALDDQLNATIDANKLNEWLKTDFCALYDTRGAERTYTRPDGKQVTVPAGTGHWENLYGWTIDEEALAPMLQQAVEASSTDPVAVPTKHEANAAPDAGRRDWGNRYIDVDLTEQHVRMYDDSGAVIWESDCVTGDHSKGHDTPTGVFTLNGNRASGDVELRGAIDPATKQPSYISHVKYWMPFIDNLWAFHDASWRGSFGGTIYQYAGSHGCINLPSDKAADLYSATQIGDVVVVHY